MAALLVKEEVIMPKPLPVNPKLLALRSQEVLNPHPEKVTDSLFREEEFFDPHDLVQVKYEMLRRVGKEGASVSEASASS